MRLQKSPDPYYRRRRNQVFRRYDQGYSCRANVCMMEASCRRDESPGEFELYQEENIKFTGAWVL